MAATGSVAVTARGRGVFAIAIERADASLSVAVASAADAPGRAAAGLVREATRATYREVTLSQLDGLLRQVIVPERVHEVRDDIVAVLANVFDYQDEAHALVEEKVLDGLDGTPLPNGSYLRVPKGLVSSYLDPSTGTTISVPGIILAAMRNVMRMAARMIPGTEIVVPVLGST